MAGCSGSASQPVEDDSLVVGVPLSLGTSVVVLVHDLHIRVLSTSGRLLRDLTLHPTRDYQPRAPT